MNAQRDTHSKLVGYLLWIIGFTGAHRFYYGKTLTGALWFCTLGLLGLGWLIDIFLIPGMDRAADQRYTSGSIDYSVAWLLLAFFGALGIHRLYMGKITSGLILMGLSGCAMILPPMAIIVLLAYLHDLFTLNAQVDDLNRTDRR
ncbi:MAG: TM2 domain-containing protein [Verrucomicrobiota bacterium]|jgi:TM2 domain-containing membrane protein YozV|nr:TM2 domain-containing protein [Verrucomicrobiota bacterium]